MSSYRLILERIVIVSMNLNILGNLSVDYWIYFSLDGNFFRHLVRVGVSFAVKMNRSHSQILKSFCLASDDDISSQSI